MTRYWTEAEDAVLRRVDAAGLKCRAALRHLPGRTLLAALSRRRHLRLGRRVRPRGETAREVRRLNALGWGDRRIADALGLCYDYVASVRKWLGLSPGPRGVKRRIAS